ncbi:hypothetical protein NC651_027773 [Populus alba x Populus x berolinensis]|nr:hypothetical protein NC651_027773 [Populus alba x Populus x berolinensis]
MLDSQPQGTNKAFSDAPPAACSEARAVHAAISSCYDSATNFLSNQESFPFPNELFSKSGSNTCHHTSKRNTITQGQMRNETRQHKMA